MSDLSTKQKILKSSISLFNEKGMANVRLQQIANDIGISAGNLAYHFKNKEAIVEAIHEDLDKSIVKILSTYRIFPNLIDFDNQLSKYYVFIQKYPFYFIDLIDLERHYPQIHAKRNIHISKMISQIRKRFEFNAQRGLIKVEPREGVYDSCSLSVWMLIAFWKSQSLLRGKGSTSGSDCGQFKNAIWNQIHPYFTKKGKTEFQQLIIPILNQYSS
ncbi:MAG: TetR/AcrR family transcriptional regulator [Bacteroidota bacterium]